MIKWIACLLAVAALSACETAQPKANASVGAGGASGNVGVNAGGVQAGVNSSGNPSASAKVVDGKNVGVSVGTGGVNPTVKAGPVRVGKRGVRLRL